MSIFTRGKVFISADKRSYIGYDAGTGLISLVVDDVVMMTASASALNIGAVDLAALLATAAEINRVADVSTRIVAVGASPLTLAPGTHEGKTVVLSLATGIAVTLPAATGSGARYKLVLGIANSSTNVYTIATAPTTDVFKGVIFGGDSTDGTGHAWQVASNSNKISLGGTAQAQGGSVGDTIYLEDTAAGIWTVMGFVQQGGTEANPFSHV